MHLVCPPLEWVWSKLLNNYLIRVSIPFELEANIKWTEAFLMETSLRTCGGFELLLHFFLGKVKLTECQPLPRLWFSLTNRFWSKVKTGSARVLRPRLGLIQILCYNLMRNLNFDLKHEAQILVINTYIAQTNMYYNCVNRIVSNIT